jgi:hypothetical protein
VKKKEQWEITSAMTKDLIKQRLEEGWEPYSVESQYTAFGDKIFFKRKVAPKRSLKKRDKK